MTPTEYDLYMEQGSSFTEEFNLFNDDATPLDLTNATITASFSRSFSETATKYQFNIVKDETILNRFTISRSNTGEELAPADRYWWNGYITIDEVPMKWAKGILTINPGVL